MNYLAHIYLSEPTLESRLGNFLGDFVKGEERLRLEPALQAGIARHMRIDDFTDHHPAVKASRKRIDTRYRYLAGVMIDVFYDHFLAVHWADYCDQPLDDFAAEVYQAFRSYKGYLPRMAHFVIGRMSSERRLESYREQRGMEETFARMTYRLSRPEMLVGAAGQLTEHYAGLDADFCEFFPQLKAHVETT